MSSLPSTARKRIAFVTLSVSLGSILYSNIKFAQRLIDEGHEVDFVGIEDVVDEHRAAFPQEVQCFALGAYRVRQGPAAFRRYAMERRPDAIVVSGHLQSLIVAAAARFLDYRPRLLLKTHVSTRAILGSQRTFFDRHLLKHALRIVAPPFAQFLAVSEAGRRELAEEVRVPLSRTTTLYDPVFPTGVREAPVADHPWLDHEDGCDFLVLFVGRYAFEKDLPLLIEAFATVAKARPGARLLMYGRGECEQQARDAVAAHGLADKVAVRGYVDPLLAYRKADVFVVSSTYEGLCNVIIEAMNEGCRVVSTDCPVGPREVLEDGRHGQLVPVGDAGALAEAILRSPELPYDADAAKRRAQDFHLDAVWPVFADLIGLSERR